MANQKWRPELMDATAARIDRYIEVALREQAFERIKDPYRTKAERKAMRVALSYRTEAAALEAGEWLVDAGLLPSNGLKKKGRR